MTARDIAFEDWIQRARKVPVREELARRGLWSKKMLGDAGNPCPGCGGTDRFAVNLRKNVWVCRASGAGGDAIALARHIDCSSFLVAVETVTGEPPPGRDSIETPEEQQRREEAVIAAAEAASQKEKHDAEEARVYRERERQRAYDIWRKGVAITGTLAEDYLAVRGVQAGPGARLRFCPKLALWDKSIKEGGTIQHEGPAMAAAIEGPSGHFAGVEIDWIDLSGPKGKVLVPDPKTGEFIAARKTRGSPKGGTVLLAKPDGPVTRLVLGEGKITVLSVYCALLEAQSELLEGAEFRAALAIRNLAGLAAGKVRHPTATTTDAAGRTRANRVDNDDLIDANKDWPLIYVAQSVAELILLADGDSDPFTTDLAMKRAVKRFARAYPWLAIKVVWPAAGRDFNDEWLASRAGKAA
jgi:hypothetical protein